MKQPYTKNRGNRIVKITRDNTFTKKTPKNRHFKEAEANIQKAKGLKNGT